MGDAQLDRKAHRTLICAVDESAEHIDELLYKGWEQAAVAELGDVVETMVSNVLHRRDLDNDISSPSESPAVFTVSVAFAALRLDHATPFREGDDAHNRKTHIDIEQPLLKNPGGSGAYHRLRAAFQDTLGKLFDQQSSVRRFAARLLLTPTDATPRLATGAVDNTHDITLGSTSSNVEYVRLPAETATRWVRIVPKSGSGETFHPIRQDDEYVFVPVDVLREKFRSYVGYGIDRIVHRGFHQFRDWRRYALRHESWHVEKEIHDKYLTNNIRSLYGTCRYDTSGASTASAASQSPGFSPVVHDHQLVNIVDVIRSSESLSFGEFVTASEIYEAALTFFPPPHRPALTLNSVQRIAQVLRSASDTDGRTTADVDCRERQNDSRNVLEYRIEEPRYTPFYTPLDDETVHRWDAYRHIRAEYTSSPLADDTNLLPWVRVDAGGKDDPLVVAKRRADTLAATQPHSRPLEDIEAAVRPADFDLGVEVTRRELRALTRVVYALNGLVRDRRLIDGMVEFTKTPHGDVSDALLSKDLLNSHEEGYQTIYSVPSDVVEALGLELFSHETFGEKGDETALHRYGIALLAYALAQRDGVDAVYRYVDLWRFNYDDGIDQVTGETTFDLDPDALDWRRVDVVAVSDGEPVYVGEVQLSHGKSELVGRNWQKLRLLAESGPEAVWLTPDFDHLKNIIQALQTEGCVADADLPSTERVSIWEQSFERKDLYNRGIAEFHTLKSLYQEVNIA